MADLVLGPSGGNGGHEFIDYAAPAGATLCEIRINAGLYVDGIQLVYRDADGALVELPHVGGKNGLHHTLTLDADEYVTGVSGRYGRYIDSIRFQTNKRSTDSFGGPGGSEEYHYEAAANSEVVGFAGRAGWYVDQLGVIVRERLASASAEMPANVGTAPAAPPVAAKAPAKSRKKTSPAADLVALPDAAPVTAPQPELVAIPDSAPMPPTGPSLIAIPESGPIDATAPELVGMPGSAPIAVESEAVVTGARTASVELGASVLPDDLTRIEGIGPKMAQVLGEAGITTFVQLAATTPARLREILDAAGNRYRMIDPGSWPEQAALAATGDWSEFAALVARLKSGRRV
jgi:predicted flap endonuclease-1-like 5' DNA nuclease